ncbi:MAG TPA: 2-hydroxyacyl-CoA dehydratase family protein, partial [Candidatus Acidoferrales bacterium]|nr:2-hydroxyacyl-CoA dehydratase family protein [Candidatus Acidoferrales bacterium]
VALNATDNGERSLCPAFDSSSDPFAALLDGYFENMADVFLRPNTRLYAWLKPRLSSRRVRGIILWCFTGCDLWRAEMQTLREIFQLPVLLLEPDDAGLSPRDANRLQAFVETLR